MRRLILVAAVFLAAVGPGHAQQTVESSVVPAGGAVPGTQVEFVTLGEALTAFGSGNVVGVGFAFTVIPAAVNQAPNAPSLLFPVDGIALNFSTPTFQWTGTDPNAGDVLTFNLEISTVSDFSTVFLSSTGIPGVSTAGVFTASFTAASPLPENIYFWRVAAFDGALTGPFASSTFVVDLTSPSLAIAFPVDGSTIATAAPAVLATYADALSGISTQTVAMFLDGSPVTPSVSLSSATFTPSPPLTDGFHAVMVEVRDRAGNVAQATSTFRVDTTTPTVTVVSPVDGSTVATSQPLVLSTYTDTGSGIRISSVALTLDGADVTAFSTVTVSSITFTPGFALADGTHTVVVSVADFAGNAAAATSTFLVDTTSPTVSIVSPVNGSTIATSQPVIFSTYADAGAGINLASVTLVLDGIDQTAQSTVTLTSITFTPSFALANGTHSVIVTVADLLGHSASATSDFQVDTTSPVVVIISPISGSTVPADTSPLFISTYTNGLAGVNAAGVRVFLDASDVTALSMITVSSATFTPFTLALGTHVFTIVVPDNVGNTTTASSTFTAIDPSTPTIVSNLPPGSFSTWFNTSAALPLIDIDFFDAGGSHLSRFETKVTTDAGGAGVPLQDFVTVQSSADFGAFVDSFTANWALPPGTFDLMQQGTNYVSVQVFDQAGNFAVAAGTFTILKDTVPPSIPAPIFLGGGGTGIVGMLPVTAGQTRAISWCGDPQVAALLCLATATDTVSGLTPTPVSLFYSTNAGADFVFIAGGLTNSGDFSWTTPIVNSTQTLLRIVYVDLAGNTAFQNGATFTIGQPDLDLITGTIMDRVEVAAQTMTTYRLRAKVLNSGVVSVPVGEDVNFTGIFPAGSCPGGGCDFNQNRTITGGPITPGTRSPVVMNPGAPATKPNPGTYVDAITITADADGSVVESNEANNSMPVTLFVSATSPFTVDVGACSINDRFSKVLVSFSTISALRNGQAFPMFTSRDEIDLVDLHFTTRTLVMAVENLTPDNFSGVRLAFKSVRGVRADTGQVVSLTLASPTLDVSLPFSISSGSMVSEQVLIDLANSIQQTGPDSFSFTPTLLRASVERRSWEIALGTTSAHVVIGQFVDIPVAVTNTGTVPDSYDLALFVSREDVQFILPSTITVAPGATQVVNLRLIAPSSIGAPRINVPFEVNAVTKLLDSAQGFFALPLPKSSTGTLEIIGDVQPPRSNLAAGDPKFGADPVFVSSETLMGITAVDDLLEVGDGAGLGVADIRFSIDGGSFTVFTSSFSLIEEGTHTVSFFATDVAANVEAVKIKSISVDNTPPVAQFTVNGTTVTSGAVTAAQDSFFGFIAEDPISRDVAAGVSRIEFSVDSGTFTAFTSTFTLSLGTHAVVFEAVDNVENRSARETVIVTVIQPVVIALDLDPDTLNLKSQGQFVTAFIEVTGTKSASDIDPQSLKISHINGQPLAAPIPAVAESAGKSGKLKFGTVGDHDSDGIDDLMVKFDRASLVAVVPVAEQVRVSVTGVFKDGTSLSAEDLIRTIQPGMVKAMDGGTLSHPGSGARASFPAGALPQDTEVSILKISALPQTEESQRLSAASVAKVRAVGHSFEFGPEGTHFAKPVTLILPYDPAALPKGVKEDSVKVAYWNPSSRVWEILPSEVDKQAKLVIARTTHFSEYQAVAPLEAEPEASAPTADTGFGLGEVYVFPNPARAGTKPTFHIETGTADQVEIRIYTVSGELSHQATLSGPPQLVDDGQGPQQAYEYTWEGHIPSGVYLYTIRARRGGSGELNKAGRLAVVR